MSYSVFHFERFDFDVPFQNVPDFDSFIYPLTIAKSTRATEHPKYIARNISLSGMIEAISKPSAESDISRNVMLALKMKHRKKQRTKHKQEESTCNYQDAKQYNLKYEKLKQKAFEIEMAAQKLMPICTRDQNFKKSFRCGWLEERKIRLQLMKSIVSSVKYENDENSEIAPISKRIAQKHKRFYKYRPNRTVMHLNKRARKTKKISLFTDRFGIPISMIDRARKKYKEQENNTNILKLLRLLHMGHNQPLENDDSWEEDSERDPEHLSPLRTTYYNIPNIKNIRHKRYFWNIYLQNERSSRIHLLLNKCVKIENEDNSHSSLTNKNLDIEPEKTSFSIGSSAKNSKESINPTKLKLVSIIRSKYQNIHRHSETCVSIHFLYFSICIKLSVRIKTRAFPNGGAKKPSIHELHMK